MTLFQVEVAINARSAYSGALSSAIACAGVPSGPYHLILHNNRRYGRRDCVDRGRREFTDGVRSRTGRAEDARRARVILLLAEGLTWDEVCERAERSRGFVALWTRRFRAERLAGLYRRHRGQKRFRCTPSVEAKILNATRKPSTDGSTHWGTRRLAAKLGVSHIMVARVWNQHRLQPHRLERYMSSNDPDFEQKAADIIGLYLNPSARAPVFCVDEKTAIHALDRTDPVLPLSPGRAERHGFEYYRHGTLGRCTRCSIRRQAKCSARPRRGTPRSSSWRF